MYSISEKTVGLYTWVCVYICGFVSFAEQSLHQLIHHLISKPLNQVVLCMSVLEAQIDQIDCYPIVNLAIGLYVFPKSSG